MVKRWVIQRKSDGKYWMAGATNNWTEDIELTIGREDLGEADSGHSA